MADRAGWSAGSYLALLSDDVREAVLAAGHLRQFTSGEVVVREGDDSTFLILVLDGFVKVTAVTPDGHVSLLAIRAAGDVVGELGALGHAPRSATVTAVGTVTVRVIPHQEFVTLFRREPEAVLTLLEVVSGKLRAANRARVDVGGYPAPVRLARVLLQLAQEYGRFADGEITLTVPLNQNDLASLASMSRAAVARSLSELRSGGVLSTGYRQLVIGDLDALSKLAEGGVPEALA